VAQPFYCAIFKAVINLFKGMDMLSDLRFPNPPLQPVCDDRYSLSMEEDLKEAISLLFKFKAALDKLNPECTRLIEKMMAFHASY
jgi:hypothetical protein